MQSSKRAFSLCGCKLDRDILGELWRVLKKDASPEAETSVSTHRKTHGEVTVTKVADLDELWAALGNKGVANLELAVTDPGSNGIAGDARSSSISFEPWRAWVEVKGPDETWVLGRAQAIEKRLRDAQPTLPADPEAVYVVAPAVGAVGGLLIFFLRKYGILHGWQVLVPLVFADLAVSVITWWWWRRRNSTEIVPANSRVGWSRADKISLVATIVTVLSLALAAFQEWGPKH
jgi:hypothetical protein